MLLDNMKAVIFDLDGTLVDSMWMWHAIDVEFLGEYGYECPEDLHRVIEGMSFSETVVYFKERFLLPLSLEEIKDVWTRMSIDKYRYEVPLKPGAREFLELIKKKNIKCGIATSNGRELVDAVLHSLGIEGYFQAVTTACEVKAGKPEPDIYLYVAGQLGVEPADCLVFEDIPAGILAGKRAGMKVCAVEDEFSRLLKKEKMDLADDFIEDYFQILKEEDKRSADGKSAKRVPV